MCFRAATMGATAWKRLGSSLRWRLRPESGQSAQRRISTRTRNPFRPFYREASARLLRENLTADAPQLQLGAEVLICDGMERLDGLPHLCRSETNELLLEMPFYQWPEAIWDTLYALCERRDIKIVLAHAERYPPEAIEQLIRDNVALQLNSECLTRPLHRKRYLTWIKNGSVKYLGSDIHMLGDGYRAWEKCVKLLGK